MRSSTPKKSSTGSKRRCRSPKRSAADDFGGQFVRLAAGFAAEINAFADSQLASGMHQRLPLHAATAKAAWSAALRLCRAGTRGPPDFWPIPLRPRTAAMSEQARRQYAAIVKHQQIVGAQKVGKLAKAAVFAAGPHAAVHVQHARCGAVGQRLRRSAPRGRWKSKSETSTLPIMPDGYRCTDVPRPISLSPDDAEVR